MCPLLIFRVQMEAQAMVGLNFLLLKEETSSLLILEGQVIPMLEYNMVT